MLLNLKQLSPSDNDYKEFDYSFQLEQGQFNHIGDHSFVKIQVAGCAKRKNSLIQVDFKVDFSLDFDCDRCFDRTNLGFDYSFSHCFIEGKLEESDESFALSRENVLDLDQLVTSDIILEFPMKQLCKPTCLGICPVCGVNKNKIDCKCNAKEIDPRLQALQALLNESI